MKPKKGKRLKTISNKVRKTKLMSLVPMLILIAVIATIILGIYLTNNGKIQIAGFNFKSNKIKAQIENLKSTSVSVEDTYGVIWNISTDSKGYVTDVLIEGSSRGESEDAGSGDSDVGKQIDEAYMPGNGQYYVKVGNTTYTVWIDWSKITIDAVAPYVTSIEKMYYSSGYESYVSKIDSQMRTMGGSGIINTEVHEDRDFAFTGYGSDPIYLEVEDTWGVKWELRRDPEGNIRYMNLLDSKDSHTSNGNKIIPRVYLPAAGTYSGLYNGKTYSLKIDYNILTSINMNNENYVIENCYISNIGSTDIQDGTITNSHNNQTYTGYNFTGHAHNNFNVPHYSMTYYKDNKHYKKCFACTNEVQTGTCNTNTRGTVNGFTYSACSECGWTNSNGTFTSSSKVRNTNGISNKSTSKITFDFTTSGAYILNFDYRVSSESNYDFLRIYLDGNNILSKSGEVTWTTYSNSISSGSHTLTVEYSKDSSTDKGEDLAQIRNLSLTTAVAETIYVEDTLGVNWALDIDASGNVKRMYLTGSVDETYDSNLDDGTDLNCDVYLPKVGTYPAIYNGKKYSVVITNSTEIATSSSITAMNTLDISRLAPASAQNIASEVNGRGGTGIGTVNNYVDPLAGYDFTGRRKTIEAEDTWGVHWILEVDSSNNVQKMTIDSSKNKSISHVYIPNGGDYTVEGMSGSVSIEYAINNGTKVVIPNGVSVSFLYTNSDISSDTITKEGQVRNTIADSNYEGYNFTGHSHNDIKFNEIDLPFYDNPHYTNNKHYKYCNLCNQEAEFGTCDSNTKGTYNGFTYSSCSVCGWTNSNGIFTSSKNVGGDGVYNTTNSNIVFEFEATEVSTLSFKYFMSTTHNDAIVMYIDGNSLDFSEGNTNWKTCTKNDISVGKHTLEVRYQPEIEVDINGYAQIKELSLTPNKAAYRVEHWKQKVNGKADSHDSANYEIVIGDTVNSEGTIGTSIIPAVRTYTGFNSPNAQTVTIASDGSTVVKYYYTRKSYTARLIKGTGISYTMGVYSNTEDGVGQYLYGQSINITAGLQPGYTWSCWDGTFKTTQQTYTFTMPANDVTLTAKATPNTNTAYKVQHWQQNLTGDASKEDDKNYTLVSGDTQNLTGTTGTSVKPVVKTYEGFTSPSAKTVTIAGNGETVVNYYYRRNSYNVVLNAGTGIASVNVGAGPVSAQTQGTYLYGASVTVSATLKDNTPQYTYGWTNWTEGEWVSSSSQTFTFTMPARAVNLRANGTQTTNAYLQVVQVRYQNPDGSYGNYSNVINTNYNYGETVSWSVAATPEYKAASITSYNVTEAKTTQVNIDRQTHTVTLNAGTGIKSIDVGAGPVSAQTTQGTYRVGQSVRISAQLKSGYTWSKWTGSSEITTKEHTFEMPTNDVAYTANTTSTDYSITYVLNGGIVTGNPTKYTVETENFTLKNPTKTGYTFTGWTGDNGTTPQKEVSIVKGSTGNKTYTANWVANTDTPYKVQHWKQKLTGVAGTHNEANYILITEDTQNLSGTTDSEITPETKTYTGFNSPSTETTTIKPDGTTVINYYYTRKSYNLTLISGTGVSSVTNVTGKNTYLYEENVSITAGINPGYTWSKWTGSQESTNKDYQFTMPANDVTLTANATPNTNTPYKVQHWIQNVTGDANIEDDKNYTLLVKDTQNLTGTTGTTVNPAVKTYTGFNSPEPKTVTIEGNGETVVNYYYTRKSYTLRVNAGLGIKSVTPVLLENVLSGATVTVSATLKDNTDEYTYGWNNWTLYTGVEGLEKVEVSTDQTYTFTMPAEDIVLTANGTQTTNEYLQIVQVRYQNPDGTYGDYSDVINRNYNYGETVNWSIEATDTYKAASITPYNVTGEKTTQVSIDRQTYTVTLNTSKGIASVNGAGTYRAGQSVVISAEVNPGYTWSKWIGNEDITTKEYTFTMPEKNVVLTATTISDEFKITYILNEGEVTQIPGNPVGYTVETETFTLKNPTKVGYKFIGWTGEGIETPQEEVTIEQGSTGDKTFIANWEANTDTPYKVQHWKQKLTGEAGTHNEANYTLVTQDTQNLNGTTDEEVTPNVKTYPGFNSPNAQTTTIKGNGLTVINYYYTRKSYNLTLNKGTGISSVNVGAGPISAQIQETYLYEESITVDAQVAQGYTWSSWDGTYKTTTKNYQFTMPASDVTLTANATPNTNTPYKVQHWIQNVTGDANIEDDKNYTLLVKDTQNLTGTTGTTVNPAVNTYTGFNSPEPKTITIEGNGETVVNYYYTRKSYTLTLNKGTGIKSIDVGAGPVSAQIQETYLSGATVTVSATLKDNTDEYTYGWKNWTMYIGVEGLEEVEVSNEQTYTFQMPAEDIVLTANGTQTTNEYLQIVQVRYQNPDGTYGDYSDVINRNYNYGETVNWSIAATDTYKAASIETYTVTGAKTTQVSVDRQTYQVTLNAGTGIKSIDVGTGPVSDQTTQATYRVGQNVSISAQVSEGYTWSKWTGSEEIEAKEYTFEMPAKDVSYTANTTSDDYSITYILNGGEVTGNPITYSVETETFTLKNPTKTGYTFIGWTGEGITTPEKTVSIEKGSTGNRTYTANWEANTNTPYKVQHWKQNLTGEAGTHDEANYTLVEADIQNLTGTTDTEVTPEVKTYPGFNSPSAETTVIQADGTTVVNYYYTRKSYNLTLNKGTGISSVNVGAGPVSAQIQKTYLYEESVSISAEVKPGYTWSKWTGSEEIEAKDYTFTMPANDVTLTANAIQDTNTSYKVQHWKQNVTGDASKEDEENYTLVSEDIQNLTGTTDTEVTPEVKTYTGFNSPKAKTVTIEGNGLTVVNYYYTRKSYTLTLNKGLGIKSVDVGAGPVSTQTVQKTYLYEESVIISAEVKPGYTWSKWTGSEEIESKDYTFTMPADNVIFTANAILDEYTVTYILNGGELTEDTQNPEKYTVETESFTLINPTKIGYTFVGWTGSNGNTPQEEVSIEKGSTGDKTYTANWQANPDTPYRVEHWRQNLTGDASLKDENNYSLKDIDNLQGTTDTEVTPNVKTYPGFTSPVTQKITITGDGKAVVKYYYTRNTDTVYIVRHWTQNINGDKKLQNSDNYTLRDTDTLKGTTQMTVTPERKAYEGFTQPEGKQIVISGEVTTQLDYYYERNTYTVTLNKGTGIASVSGGSTYLYEESVTIDAQVAQGYTWSKWTGTREMTNKNNTFTMPASDITLTANALANTGTGYTVKHWIQNLDGDADLENENNYTLRDTDNLKAATGQVVTPERKTYDGFVQPDAQEITVKGEGTTELNYYYKRRTDLSYIVKHIEKGTQKVIKEKEVTNQIFGAQIVTIDEKADIDGYNYDSISAESITITTGTNEIRIYYTKDTGLNYKVNYLEKGTNNVIKDQKIVGDQTFESTINTSIEVIPIYGYNYDSISAESITITTGENILNIYYTKKDATVTVHHYLQGTIEKVSEDETIQGKVFDEYNTEAADIDDVYELVSTTENTEGEMTEEPIEVIYYYIIRKPNISEKQTIETEKNRDYVIAGEKIIYTTTVTNTGNLGKDVIVKNNIPEGTTFIEGSIKINGEARENVTKEELEEGIRINVPMAEKTTNEGENITRPSIKTISFEVTVNEGKTGDIVSKAIVDEKQTEEIKVPVLTYERIAEVTRKDLEVSKELAENEVTVGDIIKYTIRINNTGTTKIADISIGDIIPEGTKFVSIDEKGVHEGKDVSWEIEEIGGKETKELTFTVEVKYAYADNTIASAGTIDSNTTEEITFEYKKPTILLSKEITKTSGVKKITSKETAIYYEIEVNAEVKYFVGKAIVTIVDRLPYPIYEEESELAGGRYDEETQTITWVEELEDVDTFKTIGAEEIRVTKAITLKYNYGNLDEIAENLINTVEYDIKLQEPVTTEEGKEYVDVETEIKEEEKETTQPESEIKVEIPSHVIVHHYIYDDSHNAIKLVEDERIEGLIGQRYTTTKSSKITANYICLDEQPEGHTGTMKQNPIEVSYYYELITPKVENSINKRATTRKKDENGNWIITKEDEQITYVVEYQTKIKDYVGDATIEMVMTLPAGINLEKSDIKGGRYDEQKHTITWTKEIKDINTFTKGDYTENITKEIKISYEGQNVLSDLDIKVSGKTKTYYPDNYIDENKRGDIFIEKEVKNETTTGTKVKQNYKTKLKITKIWDDNNNEKGKRPQSVTVDIKTMPSNQTKTVQLNQANNWTYEQQNEKYNSSGEKITYKVTERETNDRDLEYYEGADITETELQDIDITKCNFTITNSYRLINAEFNTEITMSGTGEITEKQAGVDYRINFRSKISNYIGEGKVTIVDTLPYRIDLNKSNIANGTYNDDNKTITWELDLSHINTTERTKSRSNEVYTGVYNEEGAYIIDIVKQIRVVYKDINLEDDTMTNTVKGKLELNETEEKEEKTASFDTRINVSGRVLVKHIIRNGQQETQVGKTETIQGKIGTRYETQEKAVGKYYKCVQTTNNTEGIIKEQDTEVIYYYEIPRARITLRYVSEEEGQYVEKAVTEVITTRYVGEKFKIEEKPIENYKFIRVIDGTGKIITQKEIEITQEETEIIYVYERIPAQVIVKYLKIVDGKEVEIMEADTINGFIGGSYEVSRKAINGYKAIAPEPENASGKFIKGTIEVKYYYEALPSGIFKVKYIDMETDEEITYKEGQEEKTYGYEIKGLVGDEYETNVKEIPYYVYVNSTENTTGKLTEIGDTIVYNYRKLNFNISVDKRIEKIQVNGSDIKIKDNKLVKIELKTQEIENTNIEVEYSIRVRNEGELAGKTKVLERLPEGYELIESGEWEVKPDGTLEKDLELEPGQSKDLNIKLRWIKGEANLGGKTGIVQIMESENIAKYEDTNAEDNISMATVIVSIKTGVVVSTIIIGMLIISFGISGYMMKISITRMRKDPKVKDIKFLNK